MVKEIEPRCYLCRGPVGELRPGYCDLHSHFIRRTIAILSTEEPVGNETDCLFPGCLEKPAEMDFLCPGHRDQIEKQESFRPIEPQLPPIESPPPATTVVRKQLSGQHLLRVRIRKPIFEKLQEAANEEKQRTGTHVTVSDMARAAIVNYLMVNESARQLELGPQDFDSDILFIINPMNLG